MTPSATVYKGYIPSDSVFVVAIEVHRYIPSDKEAEEPEKDRFSCLGQYLYNEPERTPFSPLPPRRVCQ